MTNGRLPAGYRLAARLGRVGSSTFGRFLVVGSTGFVIDATVLEGTIRLLGLGYFSARALSFSLAVLMTWWLNRTYTFDRVPLVELGVVGAGAEFVRYLASSGISIGMNVLVYAGCILLFDVCRQVPVLGVFAGSIAAMGITYVLLRLWAFR